MFNAALKQPGSVMTLSKNIECHVDPVILFRSLAQQSRGNNRILLESSEIDSKQQLKSILMNRAALRIECFDQKVIIESLTSNGDNALDRLEALFETKVEHSARGRSQISLNYQPASSNIHFQQDEISRLKSETPIDSLRKINKAFLTQNNPSYAVFLCGLFAFDFIASFEELPDVPIADNQCPDFVYYLAEELAIFDHQTSHINIYSNIFSGKDSEKQYYEQSRRMETLAEIIERSSREQKLEQDENFSSGSLKSSVTCDISDHEYEQTVISLKQEIIAGNVFQVVPSRTFSMDCNDDLLSYQQLKRSNPSPYMFYMKDEDFTLFGASPESALKYQQLNNKVELYPIAGTRIRGKFSDGQIDDDLDKRFEAELKLDQKEISEHMMLVDLARNDIARISKNGTLQFPRLLEVDRYSQVMHLVSCVQGELRNDLDCFHAYQACMNMGTLTGAPKIKATELIRNAEKKRRGSYGGAIGYINGDGDMDTCIVIRSAFCKEGKAHIQAGAGIVFDSIPRAEAEETKNKANAVIQAIIQANRNIQNNKHIQNRQVD